MADDEDGVYVFFDDSEDENYGDIDLDDYDMLTEVTDTSSAQARKAEDIQGILWDKLNVDREKYRTTRLESYKNFRNVPISEEEINKLRNLLWATSKHDVYLFSNHSVIHWSSLSNKLSEVLNFAGHVTPTEEVC